MHSHCFFQKQLTNGRGCRMETSLGRRVSALREREKLTQAQLSKKLECPRSRICKLENVDTYQPPKQYPLEFVRKLCNVLARNDTEISELFELSGHKAPPRDDILRIVRIMEDTLSSADLNQFSEELIAEVEAFVIAWGVMRQARRQKVTKVVVVAAGWQP